MTFLKKLGQVSLKVDEIKKDLYVLWREMQNKLNALEAERDDWKRKAEELTPEDMRGMAYDANALLKAKIEALEAENARLKCNALKGIGELEG
jgi:hypothetical protein